MLGFLQMLAFVTQYEDLLKNNYQIFIKNE